MGGRRAGGRWCWKDVFLGSLLATTAAAFNMFSFDDLELDAMMQKYMDPERNCTNDTTLIHLLLNTTGYNKHKVPCLLPHRPPLPSSVPSPFV